MGPSLVLLKWRRPRTPAWLWLPAASHKNGQLAHNNNSFDPMCGRCRVQGATSHIAVRFLFDHEEANQYIDSGQCDEYLLVHGQIRAGVRSDVTDRKSTRLNSSHTVISYAVFCLKKKKNNIHKIISMMLHIFN